VTLREAVSQAQTRLFRGGIERAGDEARRLVGSVLGLTSAELISEPRRPLLPLQAERLARALERRLAREPIARIVGEKEFYGRSFAISPAVLDPRGDSETAVTAALSLAGEEGWQEAPLRILDVGTGCGCLLLSLLLELPQALGVGTDISPDALMLARDNARRWGVCQRSQWIVADALAGLAGPFDIMVSNPPYIPSAQIAELAPEVRCYDPPLALDGGSDGLALMRRLAAGARSCVPEGWIILEVGHDQADRVIGLLRQGLGEGVDVRQFRDVAGWRRCVAARSRK
jgi:release factor glutamine methyltransferase